LLQWDLDHFRNLNGVGLEIRTARAVGDERLDTEAAHRDVEGRQLAQHLDRPRLDADLLERFAQRGLLRLSPASRAPPGSEICPR